MIRPNAVKGRSILFGKILAGGSGIILSEDMTTVDRSAFMTLKLGLGAVG